MWGVGFENVEICEICSRIVELLVRVILINEVRKVLLELWYFLSGNKNVFIIKVDGDIEGKVDVGVRCDKF